MRGGAYLEAGRHLKVLAFDKTGTLTEGRPTVTDILPLTDRQPDDILHIAASLDASSEHPVATAIVAHCAQRHECRHLPVEAFEAMVGRGVTGTLAGQRHFVGNHRVELDGDAATGDTYCIAHHLTGKDDYVMHIRYEDTYVRTSAGWRIQTRDLHLLWTANLPVN